VVAFFFAAGEASVEAVDVFLVVELFFVVEVPWVVVEVEAAIGSSFFCAQEPRNATVASAIIKVKTDVFIDVVNLNERLRMSILRSQGKL
jgi:hypothetical protein